MNKRYNSINDWLFARFGERVYKVSLDGGFGCPNRDGTLGKNGCIFCNFESLRPAVGADKKTIKEQLRAGIAYVGKRHRVNKVISYFQSGSNTHAPAKILGPMFEEAIANTKVVGLAISTRPDCIETEHLELMEDLSRRTMVWVELGLQSAHDSTLERINRGHSVKQFADACSKLKGRSISVCAHVILGLPGEDERMMLDTARFLNETGVWGVKIHNLHVLKNTPLEREFLAGKINIPSLETYAGWAANFLEVLDPEIVVHRVNSHSPRSLTVAPEWSINKLAIFNAVEREMEKRGTRQGAKR